MTTVDLSNWMLDHQASVRYQHVIKDTKGVLHTMYTLPQQAIIEVMYSRLADHLGIPCVKADYGEKFKDMQDFSAHFLEDRGFVSVSSFSPGWITHDEFYRKKHLTSALVNEIDYYRHILLGLIMREESNNKGYVTRDNFFIKCANGRGLKWLVYDLGHVIRNNDERIPRQELAASYTRNAADLINDFPTAASILSQLVQITDVDIESISEIPQSHTQQAVQLFLKSRLIEARETAARYLEV